MHKDVTFFLMYKPFHVDIHWKAFAEYSQMSTHVSGFQSFFKLTTSGLRVKCVQVQVFSYRLSD